VILVDLDRHTCPVHLFAEWGIAAIPPRLLFRIAIREVEAWLLADRRGIARFLRIPEAKITTKPEELVDPKQELINLTRRCKAVRFRDEIVPAAGSSAKVGPFYNVHFSTFVAQSWDVDAAEENSPSLKRARDRLKQFAAGQ
jgi:hypothetical protein